MTSQEIKNLEKKVSQSIEKLHFPNYESEEHSRYVVRKKNYSSVLIKRIPYLFTCNETNKLVCLQNYSILIEGDEIKAVAPPEEKIEEDRFDLIYDASKRGGTVVTPGFINAHAHSPMYFLRSSMFLDEGENLGATLSKLPVWESKMNAEELTLSAIGDLTEQQKFGVTTTLSHYNNFESLDQAARLTGQNVINAISVASHVSPKNSPQLIEDLMEKERTFSKLAMAVHYLYKASPEVLRKVQSLIEKNNLLFTCHFAETKGVVKKNFQIHGESEVAVLDRYGLLNKKTLVSHAVHLGSEEIAKLVKGKVGVVHLPTSNQIHKSGTFPFWNFHKAGGFDRIGLGTDSVISKSRLDILTEAYHTRITHLYLKTVKFGSLFKMMTINGARILGEEKKGRIVPGMKADLVFWKLKDRGFIPFDEKNPFSLIGNLITHSGRTARDVMVGGRFVIKDRRHQKIDESKLLETTQNWHMRLRGKV
ncbi:MAG TPA: amidohydrolase family protein [Candidatus Moranbacteria bacterium]|nr:amidohydrolase family protein [Candidatus Moranbacteria bacterium]